MVTQVGGEDGDRVRTAKYQLVLPEDSLRELQTIADKRGIDLVELLRRFIRLGLLFTEVEAKEDVRLIIESTGPDGMVVRHDEISLD